MNNYYLILKRLQEGKPYSDKLKPYSKQELSECLEYFLEVEDYESCAFIRDYTKIRFDHKNNYLL